MKATKEQLLERYKKAQAIYIKKDSAASKAYDKMIKAGKALDKVNAHSNEVLE